MPNPQEFHQRPFSASPALCHQLRHEHHGAREGAIKAAGSAVTPLLLRRRRSGEGDASSPTLLVRRLPASTATAAATCLRSVLIPTTGARAGRSNGCCRMGAQSSRALSMTRAERWAFAIP